MKKTNDIANELQVENNMPDWWHTMTIPQITEAVNNYQSLKDANRELIEALVGMVGYWERHIGGKMDILKQLPVNEHYRKAWNAINKAKNIQ
jgi:hypothetical protein